MHTYHIDENERPSMAVVRAISAVANTPSEELEPLHETVDPDALDTVFEADNEMYVAFQYDKYQVEIDDDEVKIERRN